MLHVSTRLILGGSQENTVLSCEGQSRLGHEVHLAYGPIYGPEGSMLERVEAFNRRAEAGAEGPDATPIRTHEVPHLIRPVRPVADARCVRELRALIQRVEPDVVHTHSSKAGILGRAAAWAVHRQSGGTPAVVHTIHGPPFHDQLSSMTNAAYVMAERYAARRCHVIVAVADAMTQQFLRHGIGTPEQYITVRSGMELGPYLRPGTDESRQAVRRELGLAEGDFVIGTVARLAELKGHDDLLDALGPTLREDPSWRLLWVGDGWWRERLMERVRSMGLEGRIVTTGLVPPERVPAMIRAMDVLAHPSYREGLPRTVPQALLCGVPPVAYDADGTREICIDMETGRLVPVGDVADLREAILWMHAHPDERKAMAAHGKNVCVESFSAEAMVRGLEEVYRRALAMVRA